MTREQSSHGKSTTATKPRSRSFCCSMIIYTLVFVSGVIVATILPDLVGHQFKQPYAKQYAELAEKTFQDLPKYMKKFRETAMLIAEDLGNRVWNLKTEIERRIQEMTNKPEQQSQTKKNNKPNPSGSGKSHKHTEH